MSPLYPEWAPIQRLVLASCVFLSGAAGVEAANLSHPDDKLFNAPEWREIGRQGINGGDILVLKDGRRINGRLEQIPELQYSFGSVAFDADAVASVAFGNVRDQPKIQVITRNGENFVADVPEEKIIFSRRVPVAFGGQSKRGDNTNVQYVVSELNPEEVNFIILKNRQADPTLAQKKFYHVALRNGDHLAATLEPEDIHLTDGWNDQVVSSDKLVEVVFNGGLQGCVEGDVCDQHLGFCFVKDPTIGVRVVNQHQAVRLPWDAIAELKVNMGDFLVNEQELILADLYHSAGFATDEDIQQHFAQADDPVEGDESDEDSGDLGGGGYLAVNHYYDDGDEQDDDSTLSMLFDDGQEDDVFAFDDAGEDAFLTYEFARAHFDRQNFADDTDNDDGVSDDDHLLADNSDWFDSDVADEEPSLDDMVFVRGGTFLVATAEVESSSPKGRRSSGSLLPTANKPSQYVQVPNIYVDKHEVTNGQYAEFVNDTGHRIPSHWVRGRVPAGQENDPVVNVSYNDAETYATWAGKRIPTELEWERASNEAQQVLESSVVARQEVEKDQAFSILSLIASFEPVMADTYLPQVTFGRILSEISGQVAEWTASDAVANPASVLGKVRRLYSSDSERYSNHKVVRRGFVADNEGDSTPRERLDRDACNPFTGFRCVKDAGV